MLALALTLVLGLTAWTVWLSVTEVRAVKPVPATVRHGHLAAAPEGSGPTDGVAPEDNG